MTCKDCQHHGQRWEQKIEGCSTCESFTGFGHECLKGRDSDSNITRYGKATCKFYKRVDFKRYGLCYPKINGVAYPFRCASEDDPVCEYSSHKNNAERIDGIEERYEIAAMERIAKETTEQLELAL